MEITKCAESSGESHSLIIKNKISLVKTMKIARVVFMAANGQLCARKAARWSLMGTCDTGDVGHARALQRTRVLSTTSRGFGESCI